MVCHDYKWCCSAIGAEKGRILGLIKNCFVWTYARGGMEDSKREKSYLRDTPRSFKVLMQKVPNDFMNILQFHVDRWTCRLVALTKLRIQCFQQSCPFYTWQWSNSTICSPCYSNKDESNLGGEAAAQEKSGFDWSEGMAALLIRDWVDLC